MARVSLNKLNELLARALQEHGGLITPDPLAFKPWLPESYWAEQAREVAGALFNEHLVAKMHRQVEDERLANLSVEELIGDPPGLFTPTEEHYEGRWGTHPMNRALGGGTLRAPTKGDLQPSYNNYCQWCFIPITARAGSEPQWRDHNNKCHCPDRPDDGSYGWHLPEGIEYLSDQEEDNDE